MWGHKEARNVGASTIECQLVIGEVETQLLPKVQNLRQNDSDVAVSANSAIFQPFFYHYTCYI